MTKLRGKAVLCIGSDFLNLNLRCSRLQEHGWDVLSSGTGHHGITRFMQEGADAVVLDVGGDGSEAALIAAELKRQSRELPVIMVVADRESLAQGATSQADAVLLKSEETKALHKTLLSLL
jgi:DNA-binding response OmpR family regulator